MEEKPPVISLRPSATRTVRPVQGARPGAQTEWILTHSGATDIPIEIEIRWAGTARPGIDIEAMRSRVALKAGQNETRWLAKPLPAAADALSTLTLTAQPLHSADYLADGSKGPSQLLLFDPRLQCIEGVKVSAAGSSFAADGKLNLNRDCLIRMVNGSGLDRSTDPPTHGTNIDDAWYGEWLDPKTSSLTFDLGGLHRLSELRLWNLNTRSAHGSGWGHGTSVREALPAIRVLISSAAEGPWTDLGEFKLRCPAGNSPIQASFCRSIRRPVWCVWRWRARISTSSAWMKWSFTESPSVHLESNRLTSMRERYRLPIAIGLSICVAASRCPAQISHR